ncbi:hypothetical protein D3C81_1957680 [compost metagenome]
MRDDLDFDGHRRQIPGVPFCRVAAAALDLCLCFAAQYNGYRLDRGGALLGPPKLGAVLACMAAAPCE